MSKYLMMVWVILLFSSGSAWAGNLEQTAADWLNRQFYERPGVRWEVSLLQTCPITGSIEVLSSVSAKPKRVMELLIRRAGEVRFYTVKVQTRRWIKVAVATDFLKAGSSLEQRWRWEERELDNLPQDSIREAKDLAGRRTRKIFMKDEILTSHALELEPIVKPGARVTLRVQGEGVQIATDAQALEEGMTGAWVKCKCLGSGEVLKAEVVNAQTMQIVLSRR